jgi:hypothetical protein
MISKRFRPIQIFPSKCIGNSKWAMALHVVLDMGEIITAIWSSMAIPSVFITAVDYDGIAALLDGALFGKLSCVGRKGIGRADMVYRQQTLPPGLLPSVKGVGTFCKCCCR